MSDDVGLARLGELVGAVDRLRILHPRMHHELFRELRWSRKEAEATGDGIDVTSLALSPVDMAGLQLCRRWSSMELVRQWGGGRNLEKMSRKYVAGSSAIGLIVMPTARPDDYFNGGRALERMWLTATERRLAIHPITATPYYFALLLRQGGQGLDASTIAELRALRPEFERLFGLTTPTAEVLLFRVAYASLETTRSRRRPIDDVLRRVK